MELHRGGSPKDCLLCLDSNINDSSLSPSNSKINSKSSSGRPPIFGSINDKREGEELMLGHLLNLDDLRGSFPVATRAFEFLIASLGNNNDQIYTEDDIIYFMDPQPILPLLRKIYSLTLESTKIVSNIFSNSFFVLRTEGDMAQLEIKMEDR